MNCLLLEWLAFTREMLHLPERNQCAWLSEAHSIITPFFVFLPRLPPLNQLLIYSTMRGREQSALSDGLLSISFTEWANEEAQQTDLKGEKWKWNGRRRTTKGEQRSRTGREDEGGGDISINRKQRAARGATVRRNGWWCDWLDWIRNCSTPQTWASCEDQQT